MLLRLFGCGRRVVGGDGRLDNDFHAETLSCDISRRVYE
jgi:hypothetical protein